MENEISFKAIAEVQADHKLALFCHLGLRSRLITVLHPLSPWTVDSAQGGMRCRSYNSWSFCHRRLKTDRWFPQVHPRPYSKTQGFRITKGDSFLLYYIFLQLVCLCQSSEACFVLYKLLQHRGKLSSAQPLLIPNAQRAKWYKICEACFLHLSFQVFSSLFQNCNTLV